MDSFHIKFAYYENFPIRVYHNIFITRDKIILNIVLNNERVRGNNIMT